MPAFRLLRLPSSSILAGGGDTQLLFLAAFSCVLVAAYQVVNFYLGYKLQLRIDQTRAERTDEIEAGVENRVQGLSSGDATSFFGGQSVVENTTELLEPIQREAERNE